MRSLPNPLERPEHPTLQSAPGTRMLPLTQERNGVADPGPPVGPRCPHSARSPAVRHSRLASRGSGISTLLARNHA